LPFDVEYLDMENFIVSARKYRPSTFGFVVGQKSITSTLKNAIKNNHLAQAYLFCGPRGVGKTTCARIFAKTINCFHLTEDVEPCNSCESCNSFNSSRSFNIHELDAASNNSVEDIRSLIDQVRIPPQVGKYSIYIIDEVHMLSSQAFNAFLKTLEEPPAHAIFILATTEKHKIIPTILSRCQIFDFNRIGIDDITHHLEFVASKENVKVSLDGLNIISQKADGAMRDALSYFDQIVSFSGGNVTYENVIENLNVLDYEYYFRLTESFINGDFATVLNIFNEILNKGFDGHHFITGLAKHFRDLLVGKDASTIALLEVGETIKEKYVKQAQSTPLVFILNALNIANACDLAYKSSQDKRLQVELALINISAITRTKTESTVIEPIKEKVPEKVNSTETATNNQENQNKISSISIKDALKSDASAIKDNNQQDIKIVEEPPIIKLNNEFSQEQLVGVWDLYADSIKTDKPRLYHILKAAQPQKKDATNIAFDLKNSMQKDLVEKFQAEILDFIGSRLKNNNIVIDLVIIEESEQKKTLYTDTDKLRYLTEKNPNLSKLKQQFGLDL
jgi:DNA polymerase-3 subunit gamma/tau